LRVLYKKIAVTFLRGDIRDGMYRGEANSLLARAFFGTPQREPTQRSVIIRKLYV
jgi:hypothetical protein